ncbi:hypothetical protein CRG98_046913 [Punica granatum]|uniref:Uncharacterized protein n=1 Tax=Punica granatum TaxID=22663 RepID=A0A2I0HN40_PUNGR|nr:hypothetical protein CRG98_046913 [Punica granatum]
MDRPIPDLRLEAITPPRQDIMRIWRTLRPVDRAFIQGISGDVVVLTETLRWDQGIRIAWLSDWMLLRAMAPTTASYQRDACHGFLLLIFGTLLFPYSPNLIDGAIAQVVLQAVIRQLGGLKDIPAETDRLPFRIQWADSTSTAPAWFLQIREIRRQRDASVIQRLYFPEHPTDDVRVFSATSAYVARFYARGLASPQPSHTALTPRATSTLAPEAGSSTQAAMHAELRAIRKERDRLRCELVDSRAEVADYRELQTELTRARARVAHLDREMARLGAELDRVHKRARNLAHP